METLPTVAAKIAHSRPAWVTALIYLAAVTAAELVTVSMQPIWGIALHVLTLVAVLIHSSVTNEYPRQQLILSLALVPLVRIISLSLPLASIPQLWWYPIIYGPLLVAAVVTARILGYTREDIGFTMKLSRVQMVVMLTGLGFGAAEYFILVKLPPAPLTEPLVTGLTWQTAWLPALVLLLTTGLIEEIIFRGVLQRAAVKALGDRGIVYVSFLFAIMHLGFLSWADIAFVFVIALFFGWVVKKTGSLFGVILAHGITNILLFIVMPYLF